MDHKLVVCIVSYTSAHVMYISGIKALRSVLNPMSVNNRNNMFVIKEMSTDSVYYLRFVVFI
jgi:hypothetical protein